MWIELLLFLLLAVCALSDGLRKQIPLAVVWLGMLIAVCFQAVGYTEGTSIATAAFSLILGMGFFLLSFLTGEKVGYGDGWVLLMIGLFVGFYRCFLIMILGLVAESAVAVVLLVAKKIRRDKEIPFSPFLLLGMGVTMCL